MIARALLFAATLLAFAAPSFAQERLRYGLSWLPQAEHCGFFQAKARGLYAAAGLDVELVPGGPGVNMNQLLAASRVDAAMGSTLSTLNMRAAGAPGVTIAAMFQRTPQTLVGHPNQGITRLEDLRGRPISVANFSRSQFWVWLKIRYGFDDAQLRPYTYNPSAFVANPGMVQQGYITEDAFFLGGALGAEPVALLLADYGYPDYATTIFAMEQTIAQRRAALQRFVDVSIQGYAECLTGDPAPAVAAIREAAPEQSPELSAFKLAQMRRFRLVDGGDAATLGIGAMTVARWQQMFEAMTEGGAYPRDLDWRSAFTLDFVNRGLGRPGN
jgi:NitT/TauT family transport system substrate-binding protein